MRINHNISALNTNNQLMKNNAATSSSLAKLSSGLRINSAADDAAGLAISEKMRGQISGLDQAQSNANDGISMIQTAEGALSETHSILQRMRELAVQSANDTNTDDDRLEMQKEIDQLTSEITRISTDTEFNTKKLLDGTMSNSATVSATANVAELTGASITNDDLEAGAYTITTSAVTVSAAGTDDATDGIGINGTVAAGAAVAMGDYTLTLTANGSNFDAALTKADGTAVATMYNQALTNLGGAETLAIGGLTFNWATGGASNTITAGTATASVSAALTVSVADPDSNVIGATTVTGNKTGTVRAGGFELQFNSDLSVGASTVTVESDAVSFQIGANAGQNTKLSIANMSATALGVSTLDLRTATGATTAITTIDAAITSVSSQRAALGASQNRLEHTINNLSTSSENLSAAESQIRDVDMAKEMTEYTKNNILSQAAQAMLAQANQQPQNVLQLLQ